MSDNLLPKTFNLPYPPVPEHAADFALSVVEPMKRLEGADLDFTPSSLKAIDQLVLRFRDYEEGSLEYFKDTLFRFGCYLGEVLVRNAEFTWKSKDDKSLDPESQRILLFMGVVGPNGIVANPIVKPFKLYRNGLEDGVAHFYSVFYLKSRL